MSIELFRRIPDASVGVLKPPQWNFIQTGFNKNISKVINFHRTFQIGIKSNHLLVRLLQSLAIPKTLPLERYYANVEAVSLNVAMALHLTSHQFKGRVHKGVFYGINTPELIIATDDYFDAEYVHNNWRNVSAVKPLLHAKSDLGIQVPNGKDYSDEYGLSVILINIPMLAVQYRAFFQEQINKPPDVPRKNIMQFISGYVLPNMIPASMELCLFNRVFNRFYNINTYDNIPKIKHSFALTEYTYYIDKAIDLTLLNCQKSIKRFDALLRTIPSFSHENMYQSLLMPDIAPTRQVDWALVVSRLKAYNLLIDIAGRDSRALNQVSLNQVLRNFAMHDTYHQFRDLLPTEIFFEAEAYLDNLLEMTGKHSFR